MLITDRSLSEDEMAAAMTAVLDGAVADADLATFLTALHHRGETVDELTGAARVLRERATLIEAPADTVDCCGTGGDGQHTYNVSTAVALVAAACGVPVAKHGNRASSSKSGAGDVLEALGVDLNLTPEQCAQALQQFNFTFLFATNHHPAVKRVAAIRKSLGHRTIFNLLGPLLNPARTTLQLVGVYDAKWLMPFAQTLQRLGTRRAWIVHGQDGLDEITVTAPTHIVKLDGNTITEEILTPADFGLPLHKPADLIGGDAQHNAAALKNLLAGQHGAYRDIVLANAAAVLTIHNPAQSLRQAAMRAAQAIDNGDAARLLERYRIFSNFRVSSPQGRA